MHRRTSPRLGALAVLAGVFFPLTSIAVGCGSPEPAGTGGGGGGSSSSTGGGDGGGGGAQPVTVTLHPTSAPLPGETECTVVQVTNIAIPDAHHVPVCTPVPYATTPPSGGSHWPVWAAHAKYTTAVPRELYSHNLEHGWIVLSYRCTDDCPLTVLALEKAFDTADDTYCAAHGDPAARVLLTPDPLLKTPIAMSAWGATYTATCIDPVSMADFIAKRIGRGTEMVCGGGQMPLVVTATCLPGGDAGTDGG